MIAALRAIAVLREVRRPVPGVGDETFFLVETQYGQLRLWPHGGNLFMNFDDAQRANAGLCWVGTSGKCNSYWFEHHKGGAFKTAAISRGLVQDARWLLEWVGALSCQEQEGHGRIVV